MREQERRALAAGILLSAFLGLMPLLPKALGYRSATVHNRSASTWSPGASTSPGSRFLTCTQSQATWTFQRNRTFTNLSLFHCTNNWHSDVSVSISLVNGNGVISSLTTGSAATIPSGGTGCVTVTLTTPNSNAGPNTVVYRGTASTASGASNLHAVFDFTGQVQTVNPNSTPTACTP